MDDEAVAAIDRTRRAAICRAHSATHLLQSALVKVLGDHCHQAGSLVEPDRLRFDFTHFAAVTPEELKTIYHDMYMIRTFEEMLHTIKVLGMYRQHKFSYTGPAHLSIGEEAYAVGEAFLLDENDFIFGSHRGHHEVLAKAMSAIRKIPEEKLLEIMISYHNGVQLSLIHI